MTNQETQPHLQAVRLVYENSDPSSSSNIIHLACRPDPSSGSEIILWDDIVDAFKEDVIHVRSGTVVLSYLKGPDFRK
jgi:hypothetical protein